MPSNKIIGYICCILLLVLTGCGTKKKAVTVVAEEPVSEVPSWHTCLIQGGRATIITENDRQSAAVTMQTVRDSLLVISVMPMFGMEMLRIEATPTQLIGIDKIHGRYALTTYAELNNHLTPSLNWDILQQVCSAELPTGNERARMLYTFNGERIEVIIDYMPRKTDVPVRAMHQRLDKYSQVDISRWL